MEQTFEKWHPYDNLDTMWMIYGWGRMNTP